MRRLPIVMSTGRTLPTVLEQTARYCFTLTPSVAAPSSHLVFENYDLFANNASPLTIQGYLDFSNTEPCVDIKLLTREPGRIPIGNYLDGAITRDADDHFLFIENATDKKRNDVQQRNPHVYEGIYININRKPDGTLYPTFNRPQFNKQLSFLKFCRRAAEELIQVTSGFAYNLEEEKPT